MFFKKYIDKISIILIVLRTNIQELHYPTTEPMWRKGQKSTLKKTSNDVLTISNLHVYLLFRGKRKENTRKRYYVDDSRPVLE